MMSALFMAIDPQRRLGSVITEHKALAVVAELVDIYGLFLNSRGCCNYLEYRARLIGLAYALVLPLTLTSFGSIFLNILFRRIIYLLLGEYLPEKHTVIGKFHRIVKVKAGIRSHAQDRACLGVHEYCARSVLNVVLHRHLLKALFQYELELSVYGEIYVGAVLGLKGLGVPVRQLLAV